MEFFDQQFRKQVSGADYALNPFERAIQQDFAAPGDTLKRFHTLIARKPAR